MKMDSGAVGPVFPIPDSKALGFEVIPPKKR